MSQKLPSEEQQQELSWEEAVSRYLEDNPDYFARHSEILAELKIPHMRAGAAVSLIERQVQILREKNLVLNQQLQDLVTIARENDKLGDRLHDFALSMIEGQDLDGVLDAAQHILRREFSLEQVVVLFDRPVAGGRPEFAFAGEAMLKSVLSKLANSKGKPQKPLCGSDQDYDADTLSFIFGDAQAQIKSCAIIPLGLGQVQGLLALGSKKAKRFQVKMGTVYLTKIGDLLSSAVAQQLAAQAAG